MNRHYKFPWLSRVAWYVQRYLLPDRVHAWIWLTAYDNLDEHMDSVEHHDNDGISFFDAVCAVRIENLKRKLAKEHLYGKLGECQIESVL